jgi:hypothetical protein
MFKKFTTFKNTLIAAIGFAAFSAQGQVSSFETLSTVGSNSYWDGSGPNIDAVFTSGGVSLTNTYSSNYGLWSSGWVYSNQTNTTLAGYANLYSAYPGTGAGNSMNFAIGQQGSVIKFSSLSTVTGLQVANTTYAYLSMRDGDAFAKKFGGPSGNDPDYLKITINGFVGGVLQTATGVDIYLADFTSSTSGNDFILSTWKTVDLTTLGGIDSLRFKFASSDSLPYGINTPTFVAVDNISVAGITAIGDFENLTLSGNSAHIKSEKTINDSFTNGNMIFKTEYVISEQGDYWSKGFAYSTKKDSIGSSYNDYSAIPGKGANRSKVYVIGQDNAVIKLINPGTISGLYATNTSYAYKSMKDGGSPAKKFGGVSGTDADYFKMTISAYRGGFLNTTTGVNFYLADFRSSVSGEDFIVKDWRWVNLTILGIADSLKITLASSDVSGLVINTPLYFALDDINGVAPVVTVTSTVTGTVPGTVTGVLSSDEQGFSIYPNPVNEELSIVLSSSETVSIQILDLLGNVVLQTSSIGSKAINVSSLLSGVYVVQVRIGEKTISNRLIKN